MHRESEGAEQIREGDVAYVESARESPESGQHQACLIGHKTAPDDGAAPMDDARNRVQMSGDLACGAGRMMAEGQASERQRRVECTVNVGAGDWIVVTGEPQPVATPLQGAQLPTIVDPEPRCAIAVMETVAQGDDDAWHVARDQMGKPRQGCGCVIGRQKPAAGGKSRSLFEMQIRDRQQAVLRPIEYAGGIRNQTDTGYGDDVIRSHPRRRGSPPFATACTGTRGQAHEMASLTSSSAASAKSVSAASPYTASRPISSKTGTASGETRSSALWTIRPFTRESISPSRRMSSRPAAASARAARSRRCSG